MVQRSIASDDGAPLTFVPRSIAYAADSTRCLQTRAIGHLQNLTITGDAGLKRCDLPLCLPAKARLGSSGLCATQIMSA